MCSGRGRNIFYGGPSSPYTEKIKKIWYDNWYGLFIIVPLLAETGGCSRGSYAIRNRITGGTSQSSTIYITIDT